MKLTVVFILILNIRKIFAKILVFPADNYEDCSDEGRARHIDLSELEFVFILSKYSIIVNVFFSFRHDYVNDTEYFLTGKLQRLSF
jgi:hypothetical protein